MCANIGAASVDVDTGVRANCSANTRGFACAHLSRKTQELVGAIQWGFKSPLPHHYETHGTTGAMAIEEANAMHGQCVQHGWQTGVLTANRETS